LSKEKDFHPREESGAVQRRLFPLNSNTNREFHSYEKGGVHVQGKKRRKGRTVLERV